jgi:hypothetical protein
VYTSNAAANGYASYWEMTMADLKERLQGVDGVPVPDLWAQALDRASMTSNRSGLKRHHPHRGEGFPWRQLGTVAVAFAVFAVAGVFAWRIWDPAIQSPAYTAAPSGACIPGWVVSPKPFTEGVSSDHLVAASGTSPTDVWAVGTRFLIGARADDTVALFEHWDGDNWTVAPGADTGGRGAFLTDVVALAPDDVWAVGGMYGANGGDLIEHWDGTGWSLIGGSSDQSQGIETIAGAGTDDIWAKSVTYPRVGGQSISRDIYEHWDGAAWSTLTGPIAVDPSIGTAATQVIAVGPSGDVWAAGGKVRGFGEAGQLSGALVERWNGERWVETSSPPGDQPISGLAVIGEHDAWALTGGELRAVGTYGAGGNALVHWDGHAWGQPFEVGGTLLQTVARGPDDVWAVGNSDAGEPLIERWNGERWQQVDSNAPGEVSSGLLAANVTSAGTLLAFGSDYPASEGGFFEGPIGEMSNYLWIDCI